mgnify:FL=1
MTPSNRILHLGVHTRFIQFELRSAQPRTRGRERVDRSYGYLLDLLIRGIQR